MFEKCLKRRRQLFTGKIDAAMISRAMSSETCSDIQRAISLQPKAAD
jgi:hypothetical protein